MCDPVLWMKIRDGSTNNTFGLVRTYPNGTPKPHQGWDLEALVGTHVFAIADGTIAWTQPVTPNGDYGNQILLKYTGSSGVTRYAFYAHLSSYTVKADQTVVDGELIGATGQTGNAANTTPHLHIEIRDTDSQSPGLGLAHRIDPAVALGPAPLVARSTKGEWGPNGFVSSGPKVG